MRSQSLALLLTVSALAATSIAYAADSLSESEILQEFYIATNGDSWNANDGWEDNTSDYCSWFGVVCEGEDEERELDESSRKLIQQDDERRNLNQSRNRRALSSVTIPENPDGKVIALQLKRNNLQGRIPASLWKLPNLQILTLTDNAVDVAFVGESDTLIELKMHRTSTNTLTGISRYPNLLSLHMSGTPLGNVQFPSELLKLTLLNYLHMAECQVQGTIPATIFDLDLLEELNLYNNELTGLIPDQLSVLTHLRLLNLSSNHLRGQLPDFLGTALTKLQELYLEYNMLTGPLLAFNSAPRLFKLYLDGNELSGEIPSNFLVGVQDKGNTIHVNLDHNQFSGTVPDSLDALQDLPLTITFAGNLFTGFGSEEALCDNVNWMDGNVANFGCDAILCPVGTSAILGRHTSSDPCVKCKTGTKLGQMKCLDQDDRRTLQFLYSETGGDHWDRNDNWMDDSVSVCEWYGISCYTAAMGGNHLGRVKVIKLDDNGLVGSISSHIYALDVATEINLSWNKIEFPFEDISITKNLNILNVGHTDTTSMDGFETAEPFFKIFLADHLSIDGTIPSQIYQNTNMRILSLNNCGLDGTISTEIGSLTNLEELYLWGNNLKGSIPTEIGLLTDLRIISLAKNQLTGTLPTTLESLTALQAFTIKDQVTKGGGLSGNLLPFQYSTAMANLILSGNKFQGSIPDTMVSSVDPDSIAGSLILDLSKNELTGSVPGTLSKFDQMELFVETNFITSVDSLLCSKFDWMSGSVGEYGCDAILCPKFTASPLGRQAFGGITCQSCPNPNAENLSFGQTSCVAAPRPLTEREILEKLFDACDGLSWTNNENWKADSHVCEWYGIACDDAKSVVSVVLGSNNMKGTIPQEIFALPNLQRLSIFSNPIDISFAGIESAVNLKSLILDDTQVVTIEGVGKARGLTELNIRANTLKGTLPDEIANLNSLRSLILSDNEFTGTLPLWLGKLNSLANLMLSNNKFTGTLIPFENFSAITLMALSRNKFSGTIPDDFLAKAQPDEKVFCDISDNMLTGTIPASLAHLNVLSLHAHNNRIVGVAGKVCRMESWNDYDLQNYGCDGLLCPSGTFNPKGRQSSPDSPCTSCPQNQYYGGTTCSSSIRAAWSGLIFIGGIVVTVAMTAW